MRCCRGGFSVVVSLSIRNGYETKQGPYAFSNLRNELRDDILFSAILCDKASN